MNSYYHFEKNPPVLKSAHFGLPEAPGYGIELDEKKVESQEMMRWN
jgi:L-rhamnonate dehydratase